ncbi:hypothetical protein PInf_011931 [Phytophthora infestans]|nr:hypothetical protein PInf_011931 [Phytophthora infestans]
MLTPEAVDLRREVARQHRELAEAEESDSDSDVVEVPRPPSPPREVIEISDDELESPRNRRQAPSQREWQRDIDRSEGELSRVRDEVERMSDTGYTSEEDRGRSRFESEDESEETSLRSKNRSHDVSTDAASAEFHISRILNRINELGDDHTIVIRPVVNTSNLWDEGEPLNDIRIVFSDGKFKFVSEETGHNRPSIARRINWRLTLQNLEETERDILDVGEYLRFRDERRFPKQREVETSDDVHSDSSMQCKPTLMELTSEAWSKLGGERYAPVFKASDDNHTWYFDETGALRSRNSGKITHLKSVNTIDWEATLQDLVARLGPNRLPNSFTRNMTYQHLAIDLNESQAHKACKGRGIRLTPGQFGKGRLSVHPENKKKLERSVVKKKGCTLNLTPGELAETVWHHVQSRGMEKSGFWGKIWKGLKSGWNVLKDSGVLTAAADQGAKALGADKVVFDEAATQPDKTVLFQSKKWTYINDNSSNGGVFTGQLQFNLNTLANLNQWSDLSQALI